jgi:C4-dicarboxylate-specific signal transduction histidine kinase
VTGNVRSSMWRHLGGGHVRAHTWQAAYLAAVFESDPDKALDRIFEAQQAIQQRLLDAPHPNILECHGLLVSVTVAERNRHEQTLQRAKSELEERVFERTRELEKRIASQERADLALRGLSARLLETQD